MKRKRKGRRGRNPHGPVRKDDADVIGMRVVELLEACAGTRAKNGEPISMVTISHDGNIETIAFNLRDSKRLAIHALANLFELDVPLAKQIIKEHFMSEGRVRLDQMDADIF